jgi:hypothetical protein
MNFVKCIFLSLFFISAAHGYHVSCQHSQGIQITMLGDTTKAKSLGQNAPVVSILDVDNFKMPARLFIFSNLNGDRLAVDGNLISKDSSRIITFKEVKDHKIGIEMKYRNEDNSFETKVKIGPLPTTVGNIKCMIDYFYNPKE